MPLRLVGPNLRRKARFKCAGCGNFQEKPGPCAKCPAPKPDPAVTLPPGWEAFTRQRIPDRPGERGR